MKHSHGFYSKHSRSLTAGKRRGITKLLAEFEVGSNIRIKIDPRENASLPLRFNGKTGKIIGKQGKAYVVEFRDINKTKQLVLVSGHLKSVV